MSYPFVYFNGEYCCASGYEKFYKPQGAKCDGSRIQYDSLCCTDNDFIDCPTEICSNAGRNYQQNLLRFANIQRSATIRNLFYRFFFISETNQKLTSSTPSINDTSESSQQGTFSRRTI